MAIDLNDYEIFRNFVHKDKVKILSFIENCYNKESPLWKTYYGDLVKIRRESAIKAGFDPDSEEAVNIIELRDDSINELINYYICRVQNNNEFDLLIGDQHLLWELQEQIRKTSDYADPEKKFKEKTFYADQADKVQKRINDRLDSLFFREGKLQKLTETQIRKSVEQRALEFDSYKIKSTKKEPDQPPPTKPEPVKELDNIEEFEI